MNRHFITKTHIEHVRHLKEIDIPLSQESCKHLSLTGWQWQDECYGREI